jgi:hypothetical protein
MAGRVRTNYSLAEILPCRYTLPVAYVLIRVMPCSAQQCQSVQCIVATSYLPSAVCVILSRCYPQTVLLTMQGHTIAYMLYHNIMLTHWQEVMQCRTACKTSDAATEINTIQQPQLPVVRQKDDNDRASDVKTRCLAQQLTGLQAL